MQVVGSHRKWKYLIMSVGRALVARQKAGVTKRNKEIWSDEYTHYCDCGDGLTWIHTCPNLSVSALPFLPTLFQLGEDVKSRN